MKRYKPLYEAKDISNIDPFSSKLIEIQNKDELVKCWHGTNTFWTLWFCTKGISGDIDPPTKTLGRGNMNTGFSKIKTHGLFVSANQTFGFLQYIQIEVKPSELNISLEMEQRGYTYADRLKTLIMGESIIIKPLPAKRIIRVRSNNKEYGRKEFIKLFDNPQQYLENNYDVNMYNDNNPLRHRIMKEKLFKYLKNKRANGKLNTTEEIKNEIKDFEDNIKMKTVESIIGISIEDARDIIKWLEKLL